MKNFNEFNELYIPKLFFRLQFLGRDATWIDTRIYNESLEVLKEVSAERVASGCFRYRIVNQGGILVEELN